MPPPTPEIHNENRTRLRQPTKEFLHTVPHSPGVYLMRDSARRLLYVGKARDLHKRLASYRRSPAGSGSKTSVLLARVADIEIILTGTEKEAFILESTLIKRHRPRYNITLRDDKNYPYLKVTVEEEWPRLIMTRHRRRDGSRYFGPYSSAGAMWETLKLINRLFPLRRCKGKKPVWRRRPCLNFQLGRCPAPCAGLADPARYRQGVENILLVLAGRNRELKQELERKMQSASAAMQFEQAAVYRDQLRAISRTLEKQVVVSSGYADQDVFGYERENRRVAVSVLQVRQGVMAAHSSYLLEDPLEGDAGILTEVLKRFYGDRSAVPAEVLLPFPVDDRELLAEWLADIRGSGVRLLVPGRGDRRKLLQLAAVNAEQHLAARRQQASGWRHLGDRLAAVLGLDGFPARIECVDISNLQGEQPVGSLVCFVEGEKAFDQYRHYRIRCQDTPDDYAMLGEVLNRRLTRGLEQDNLPDLLLVDGGKGQLGVAVRAAGELGLADRLNLAGIAKEKNMEGEKIYLPGRKNPLRLARNAPELLFLMRIRDEAHRFGITFHRQWRQRDTLFSLLDRIPGVGPARREALLSNLGSYRQVAAASREELAAVPGIGPGLAGIIHQHLHGIDP